MVNRPYDIFGTWFSDEHLISGDLHWLAHLVSTSVLWLNKANQEIDSEHVPIMNQLYKFYNRNASSIRGIMVANCPWLDDTTEDVAMATTETETDTDKPNCDKDDDNMKRAGNPLSHPKLSENTTNNPVAGCSSHDNFDMPPTRPTDNTRSIQYTDEFRKEFDECACESGDEYLDDEDDTDSQLCKYDVGCYKIAFLNSQYYFTLMLLIRISVLLFRSR